MSILGFMILVFAVIGVVVSIEKLYRSIRGRMKSIKLLQETHVIQSALFERDAGNRADLRSLDKRICDLENPEHGTFRSRLNRLESLYKDIDAYLDDFHKEMCENSNDIHKRINRAKK